jgi:hypothetical protein
MAPSDVPVLLPAEECGRHGACRFERPADFELPESIPLVPESNFFDMDMSIIVN